MKFKQSALRIVASALSRIFDPPVPILPSQWARENLVVPDGPRAGEKWDPGLTPYIIEPLDKLSAEDATNKVVVQKSDKSGFTMLGIAWIGYSIDRDPCRMGVVQPTDSALGEFLKEKLNTAIEATPILNAKVRTQQSRQAQGSTTYTKRYPGGSLSCLIATSTADLRSKTLKKIFKDEASEYPDDLENQGSPHAMIEARYESFLASGDWKELNVSTPVIKGGCYISEEFEAGDQRHWHVTCPHCAEKFYFQFDRKYFKFNDTYPFEAEYAPPCCGVLIKAHEKNGLVRGGQWVALAPAPGKHASYHFDALSSPFVPWDKIAERFMRAGDDPSRLKGFYNLVLGLPFELRTDTPDHTRLMERREDLVRGHIPHRGLLLVAAADVQMRGIYVEVLAIGADRQSWVVESLFLDGDTSDPEDGAFAKLTTVYEREYPDAFGNRRRVDVFGVDSGYRSNIVYTWCRNRVGAMALKGVDGWSRPALGTPTLQDVDFGGRKIKKGATLWTVGTWPLKASFYSDLRKEGLKSGKELDPPGYCHFGSWMDEVYFRQITAEYVTDERFKGRTRKVWKLKFGEENHFLDCRVYNLALAEFLGLSRMTPDDWQILARERGVPEEFSKPDLMSPTSVHLAAVSAPKTQSVPSASASGSHMADAEAPLKPKWFGGRNRGWNKR